MCLTFSLTPLGVECLSESLLPSNSLSLSLSGSWWISSKRPLSAFFSDSGCPVVHRWLTECRSLLCLSLAESCVSVYSKDKRGEVRRTTDNNASYLYFGWTIPCLTIFDLVKLYSYCIHNLYPKFYPRFYLTMILNPEESLVELHS